MTINFYDFGVVGDYIVAKSLDTNAKGWYYGAISDGLSTPEFNSLVTPDTDAQLSVTGNVYIQIHPENDTGNSKVWVDALLINSANVAGVNNFAVYVDPETNQIAVKEWTEHYPSGTPTNDAMPYASVATMWKDYLVLGDIVWTQDDTQPISVSNASRYGHGFWLSIPGKSDSFDPIDVGFIGQNSKENNINGLFPLEAGLLITTPTLVSILKGGPSDPVYRELRQKVGPRSSNCAAYWPDRGGVVFADDNNHIWFTNGEDFTRIDGPAKFEDVSSVCCYQEYVIVADKNRARVLRVFDENGGWTTLISPFQWGKAIIHSSEFFGLQSSLSGGTFLLGDNDDPGPELYSLLVDGDSPNVSDNLLWDIDGKMIKYVLNDEDRGNMDGKRLISLVRTKPLPETGHRTTFWHRYGVRANGPGRIRKGISRPSSDPSERGWQVVVNGNLDRQKDWVFPAHGPSFEATFDIEFDGDITVEGIYFWLHLGRMAK